MALAVIDHLAQLLQLVVLGHGALADQCWTSLRIICKPNVRFVTFLSILSLSPSLSLSCSLLLSLCLAGLRCIALLWNCIQKKPLAWMELAALAALRYG